MTPASPNTLPAPVRRLHLRHRTEITTAPRQPWFVDLARPRPATHLFKPFRTTGQLAESGALTGRET